MKQTAVAAVFDAAGEQLLLRRRRKEPYLGLYDFFEGKREGEETGLDCVHRVLAEALGIGAADVTLEHVMDFAYPVTQRCVQVFAGHIGPDAPLRLDMELHIWCGLEEDFLDEAMYAGEGYISHVLAHLRMQQTEE